MRSRPRIIICACTPPRAPTSSSCAWPTRSPELDGIEGAQTHRSWWVAKDAIADVKRDGSQGHADPQRRHRSPRQPPERRRPARVRAGSPDEIATHSRSANRATAISRIADQPLRPHSRNNSGLFTQPPAQAFRLAMSASSYNTGDPSAMKHSRYSVRPRRRCGSLPPRSSADADPDGESHRRRASKPIKAS